MVQDQYRAVMQYTHVKEALGKEKIVTDWYCAKVYIPFFLRLILVCENKTVCDFSVASSILNAERIALNATHRVKKAKKEVKAATKSATF